MTYKRKGRLMNKLYESIKNKYQMYLLKKQHLTLMIRLHALLSHGFTLVEAMTFLFKQLNVKDKSLANSFTLMLKNGSTCYELLKFLKFPNTILMQLYFAERYSALPSTLKQCHIYYKQNQKLVSQFYKSIQYPLLLLLIFIFLIIILNHTVMPEFQSMYQSMDIKENPLQHMLQRFIAYFPYIFLITLIICLLFYCLFKKWLNRQSMSRQIKILSHLPILNSYYRLYITYQITNQFALFFKNGISLNDIVHIYMKQKESLFLQYLGVTLRDELNEGKQFTDIMRQFSCFEPRFIDYIEQGEKRDKLDIELIIYSQFLLDYIQEYIRKHISFIQPVMFVLIGCLILSVYLVMMLPIFEMIQTIEK